MNADIVFSDWRMVVVNEHGVEQPEEWVISGKQADYTEALMRGWWNPIHSYLISKEAYLNVGGSDPELVNAQDFDVLLRMAIEGAKFDYLSGNYSNYFRFLNHTSLARGSRIQYWRDTEMVVLNALKILDSKNNLTQEYKKAAAQRLFHVARNVYKIDAEWNRSLYSKIKDLDPSFYPQNESIQFKILYHLFGYYNAEKIISLIK